MAGENPFAQWAAGPAESAPNPFAQYAPTSQAAPPEEPSAFGRLAKWADDAVRGVAKPGSPVAEKGVGGAIADIPHRVGEWWRTTPSLVDQMETEGKQQHQNYVDMRAGKKSPAAALRPAEPFGGVAGQIALGMTPGPVGAAKVRGAGPAIAEAEAAGVPRPVEAPAVNNLIQDFQDLGVSPTLPAVTQSPSISRISNFIRQTPIVGAPVQKGAQRSVNETAAAAENIAGQYGDAVTPRQAGRALQEGAESFVGERGKPSGLTTEEIIRLPTRNSSFAEKSATLYDEFGKHFKPDQPIAIENAAAALGGPADRFASNPEFGKTLTDPKFATWLDKLQGSGTLTFNELKEFRSYIGKKLSQPSVVSDIPRADLENLYGGITKDLKQAATDTSPQALRAFDRANSYYGAGRTRIDDALKQVIQANSPEAAFADVMQAAAEKGKGADVGKLYALRRSMPPEQWNDVAAYKVREMGRPTPGNRDVVAGVEGNADWSPATFVTSYEKLSPEARNVLFDATGNQPLRQELDKLVRVAGAQRNVEKLANHSNSGSHIGTGILGASAATWTLPTIAGALATSGAGAAMMNPTFVRWLTGAVQTAKNPNDFAARLTQLGTLTQKYPDLRPAYQALSAPAGAQAAGAPDTRQ